MVDAPVTPQQAAWTAFRRKPSVRIGLGLLVVAALVAVYAPFLSSEACLIWHDEAGWSSPLLRELFDANQYRKPYDLAFNLLSLWLLPVLAVGWLRRWSWPRRLWIAVLVPVVLAAAAYIPLPGGDGGWRPLYRGLPVETRTSVRLQREPAAASFAIATPLGHRWDATYPDAVLKAPGTLNPATGKRFWLGTDSRGRCVAAQMAFGARISLTIGFVATAIAFAIGITIGAASGYFGGKIDLVLQRVVEIMMCFPTFILILVVVAALGRDIFIIVLVQGLTGWAGIARLVRGEFLVQGSRDYVLAGQALGLGRWRIMMRHILPNCMTPLLITATFDIAGAVLGESGLSFVGLGDATTPSWGQLLNQGRENIQFGWLIWVPGLAVFLLVSALNLVGNGLRTAFDPKAR